MGPNALAAVAALALAAGAAAASGDLLRPVGAPTQLGVMTAPTPAVGASEPGYEGSVTAPGSRPAGGLGWPTGSPAEVLRRFSEPRQRWSPGHRGVDLAAEPGAEVRAPAAGTVAFAGFVAGRPVLSVLHGSGARTTYEPVDAHVAAGARVDRGDLLGNVAAEPAHCDRSCLHWGVRLGRDHYVDPLSLLAVEPVIRLFVDAPVRVSPSGQALG